MMISSTIQENTSSALLGEAMKQELQLPKSGSSRQKVMKTKGTHGAEASQNRMSKQTIINKGQNMKSPSSIKSNPEKLDTKPMRKTSKERNLDSVKSKEEKSRKRKNEEEQKKSKSNSVKSPTQEAKRRKETKLEPVNKNSGEIFLIQSSSKSKRTESRKPKPDMKLKKTKATSVSAKPSTKKPSAGTATQNSVKRSNTSSKSDQGKSKKQKESGGTDEKLESKSPNSKLEARVKNHDSFSKRAAPSDGRTPIATLKKPRPSSRANSVKSHQTQKDVGNKKNPKAIKHEILTSLVEKSREPSARRVKIMRALGLIPPAASPFIRTDACL